MPIRVGSLVQFLSPEEIDEALRKAELPSSIREQFVNASRSLGGRIYTVIQVDPAFGTEVVKLRFGTETLDTLGSTLIGADCLKEISKYPSNYAKQIPR